jgi:hypothetical protein
MEVFPSGPHFGCIPSNVITVQHKLPFIVSLQTVALVSVAPYADEPVTPIINITIL